MQPTIFKNIKFFKKTQASLDDFKGKWLILDFWDEHCPYCIKRMPAINDLQAKFTPYVQLLLVGYDCKDCRIQSLYEKYRTKYNLNLAVSFDSDIFDQFKVTEMPRIVAIDSNGIVRGVSTDIEEEDVKSLLVNN